MKLRFALRIVDWAVPLAFGAVLCLAAPLRTALEFGGDEGYELMKAFLVSRGHPLYREIWNDQPPLHTELLALLFRLFGPSAYVGRLLAVGFAMALVTLLYRLVSDRSGRVAGLVAVVLLISSSYLLQLSASVMLEVPAMTLALAAFWAYSKYFSGKGKEWLIFSGVLFGCALQAKLTAVIFAPAIVLEFLVRQHGRKQQISGNTPGLFLRKHWDPLVWSGAVLAAFGVIASLFYGPDTLRVFWESHFSGATLNAVATEESGLRLESLLNDLGLLVPATLGIAVLCYKRLWQHSFAVVLLATVCLIHFWHRPYWYYYHLHFAFPLAWLGAVGIVEWFRGIWQFGIGLSLAAKIRLGIACLGWSLLASLTLTLVPEKAWNELQKLSAAPAAAEDLNVIALKQRAMQTPWVVADRVIYPFWAGLPVPPELAVIVKKRVWSGQINKAQIIECLERYRPEQILFLSDWEQKFELSDYLHEHYEVNPNGRAGTLYLRKQL